MMPARKKLPPGDEGASGFKKKDIIGPEGPMNKILSIKIPSDSFTTLSRSNFAKLRIVSEDGVLALDIILKKSGAGLVLVPRQIPSISLEMDLSSFEKNFSEKTVIQLLDSKGRFEYYDISDMRRVEFMKDPLWSKTLNYSN